MNRRLLVSTLICALWPAVASAQAVRGTVVDSAGRPLSGVDVILASTADRVRTDTSGRFALPIGHARVDTVRARLIGYRPAELVIGRSVRPLRIMLHRAPQRLETVRVLDQNTCDPSSLAGFECRRAAGVGHFRGAAELRALRPVAWADMFDGMPGVRRVMSKGPYGQDWKVAPPPGRCLIELWNGQPPMDIDKFAPHKPDEFWKPADVVAIELYDDYDKVPLVYRRYAWPFESEKCGIVVYWLRGAARTPIRAAPVDTVAPVPDEV